MTARQFYPFSPNLYNVPGMFFEVDDNGGSEVSGEENANAGGKSETQKPDQAVLDREFANRAARAKEAERARIFEALGLKSEDEFKAFSEGLKNEAEAKKTELQKLAERATKAESDLVAVKSTYETTISTLKSRIVGTEIKIAASQNVLDKDGNVIRRAFRPEALDDVLLLISREGITEDEKGNYQGIEKALTDLAKTKAYLLADDTGNQQQRSQGTPKHPAKKSDDSKGSKPSGGTPIINSL